MGKPGMAVPGGRASDSRVPFWRRHSRSRVVVTSDTDSYTNGRESVHDPQSFLPGTGAPGFPMARLRHSLMANAGSLPHLRPYHLESFFRSRVL